MALSNVFHEPRREITESVVGIGISVLVVGTLVTADYQWASWVVEGTKQENLWPLMMVLGLLLTIMAILLSGVFIFATHAIGEGICNALARRGLELRPKAR